MVGICEQLVVVELADERDAMRVFARDRAEYAERRDHRVAAALDRELYDLLAVEVDRVGRKRRAGGVLDALVDRKDRKVAGAGEAAMIEEGLQVAQSLDGAVAVLPDAAHEVRAGQVELALGHRLALVLEQVGRVFSEQLLELGGGTPGHSSHQSLLHI